jgi:hypothetical protein
VLNKVLVVVAAVGIALSGYVHLRIWQNEYRHAPVREMFLAQVVVSALVAVLLLMTLLPGGLSRIRRGAAAVGALVSLGSLAAFALSRGPGLPTLHGKFKETGLETTRSYVFHLGSAKVILVAEAVAALACLYALIDPTRSASGV